MPAAAAWRVRRSRRSGTPRGSHAAGTTDCGGVGVLRVCGDGQTSIRDICIVDADASPARDPLSDGCSHGSSSTSTASGHFVPNERGGPERATGTIDAAAQMYGGTMEPGRPDAICYHVVPGRDEGWDVVIEHEHHVVSSTHCSDWHRVERICAALDAQQRRQQRGPRTTDQQWTTH